MRRLAIGIMLLLAACQSDNDQPATAPVPVETTSTTVAPTTTTTAADPKLGSTQQHEDPDGYGGRITVFRYRDGGLLVDYLEEEIAKENKRTVAVEVRVCVDEVPPGGEQVSVSWAPWSLGDDSGGSYEAWSSYSDDLRARPVYPDGKITPRGTCRRGWVPFEIDKDAKPTFVEYNPGAGVPLTWPLER